MLYEDTLGHIKYITRKAQPEHLYDDATIHYKLTASAWILERNGEILLQVNNKRATIINGQLERLANFVEQLDFSKLIFAKYVKQEQIFIWIFNDGKIASINNLNSCIGNIIITAGYVFAHTYSTWIEVHLYARQTLHKDLPDAELLYNCDDISFGKQMYVTNGKSAPNNNVNMNQMINGLYIADLDDKCIKIVKMSRDNTDTSSVMFLIKQIDGYVISSDNDHTYINGRIADDISICELQDVKSAAAN